MGLQCGFNWKPWLAKYWFTFLMRLLNIISLFSPTYLRLYILLGTNPVTTFSQSSRCRFTWLKVWLCPWAVTPIQGNIGSCAACFCPELRQETPLPAAACVAVHWENSLKSSVSKGNFGMLLCCRTVCVKWGLKEHGDLPLIHSISAWLRTIAVALCYLL